MHDKQPLHETLQLPASTEAEQSVIGGLIQDGTLIDDILEIIKTEDFYYANNRDIFKAATSLFGQSKEIDIVTLADEMVSIGIDPDLQYMSALASNVPVSQNIKAYAHIVRNHAIRRALIAASSDISRYAYSPESNDIRQTIDFAQSAIMRIDEDQGDRLEIVGINSVIKQTVSEIERRWRDQGKIDGLATRLKTLDERVNGYKPGRFIVIAGRPGMAKSTLALQMAVAFSQGGHNGIFFSLEMGLDELGEKSMANIGKIPLNLLQKPTDQFWDEFSPNLELAARTLKDKPIRFVDCPGIHINQIKSYARKAHKKNKLSWLMVDHLHITQGDGKSNHERYSQISKGLKHLAKELHIPVFGLAQLNRDVEKRNNKRPLISDLRESGSLEEDADIIHLLYREDYYAENPEDCGNAGLMEVITGKFRNGKRGTDYFEHRLDQSRIQDTERRPIAAVKTHYRRNEL